MAHSNTSKSSRSNESSRGYRSHSSQRKSKLLLMLHYLSAILSFTSICLFATILPLWAANFNFKSGFIKGDWPDALPIGPLLFILTTNLYNILKPRLDQRFRSSDYLKARNKVTTTNTKTAKIKLYLQLTTLFLLLAVLVIAGISGLYRFWRPAVITSSANLALSPASGANFLSSMTLHLRRDISGANPTSLTPPASTSSSTSETASFHSCTVANIFTRKCNPTLYVLGDLQIAAITLASIVWLLNVTLFLFAAKSYQHQKRKLARSLRAKAKAKHEWIEEDLSKLEKGNGYNKKIHHGKRDRVNGSSEAATVSPPREAHLGRSKSKDSSDEYSHSLARPKLHYYDPQILPSRSRSTKQVDQPQETRYSKAVEEARRAVRPAETMRDWLAGRQP